MRTLDLRPRTLDLGPWTSDLRTRTLDLRPWTFDLGALDGGVRRLRLLDDVGFGHSPYLTQNTLYEWVNIFVSDVHRNVMSIVWVDDGLGVAVMCVDLRG